MARFERAEILWVLDRRLEAARDWLRFVEVDGFSSLTPQDAARLRPSLLQLFIPSTFHPFT